MQMAVAMKSRTAIVRDSCRATSNRQIAPNKENTRLATEIWFGVNPFRTSAKAIWRGQLAERDFSGRRAPSYSMRRAE